MSALLTFQESTDTKISILRNFMSIYYSI